MRRIKYNTLKLCIIEEEKKKKIIWRFRIRSLFAINEVMIRLSELTKNADGYEIIVDDSMKEKKIFLTSSSNLLIDDKSVHR
jgi:hypothetical protein